jgi:AcrR family transcriptional regulator
MTPSELQSGNGESTRTRERFNRDDNVIAAAIEVMSAKGYASTSVQEVADRVGVLKGSLYHYFSSKEELLYRILEASHAEMQSLERAVVELDLPPLEHLLMYIRRSGEWYLANRDRANIFFTETKHLTGDRMVAAEGWGRAFERAIGAQVAAGQADGSIRSDLEQRLITRFILSAVNNVRAWPSRRSGRKFEDAEIINALVELVDSAVRPRA